MSRCGRVGEIVIMPIPPTSSFACVQVPYLTVYSLSSYSNVIMRTTAIVAKEMVPASQEREHFEERVESRE
jgi:hypothetical protein